MLWKGKQFLLHLSWVERFGTFLPCQQSKLHLTLMVIIPWSHIYITLSMCNKTPKPKYWRNFMLDIAKDNFVLNWMISTI
jgi:hypothetical protein